MNKTTHHHQRGTDHGGMDGSSHVIIKRKTAAVAQLACGNQYPILRKEKREKFIYIYIYPHNTTHTQGIIVGMYRKALGGGALTTSHQTQTVTMLHKRVMTVIM